MAKRYSVKVSGVNGVNVTNMAKADAEAKYGELYKAATSFQLPEGDWFALICTEDGVEKVLKDHLVEGRNAAAERRWKQTLEAINDAIASHKASKAGAVEKLAKYDTVGCYHEIETMVKADANLGLWIRAAKLAEQALVEAAGPNPQSEKTNWIKVGLRFIALLDEFGISLIQQIVGRKGWEHSSTSLLYNANRQFQATETADFARREIAHLAIRMMVCYEGRKIEEGLPLTCLQVLNHC